MLIEFFKYQGAGNDFILLNNAPELTKEQISFLCHRRFGIGADGLISISKSNSHDFKMRYYNSDGAEGTMCGNGGRCAAAFALRVGYAKELRSIFEAIDGTHEAFFLGNGNIKLKMIDVQDIKHYDDYSILNTGSPHYIALKADINNINVFSEGKKIRHSFEGGVNVNFVNLISNKQIEIRTYERGVENETYACGTGATAAVLALKSKGLISGKQCEVKAVGGDLLVEFEQLSEQCFNNIYLSGSAKYVFSGKIEI